MSQSLLNTAKGGIPLLLNYKIIFGEAVVGVPTNNHRKPRWWWGHQASGNDPGEAVVGVPTNNHRKPRWWWGHQASGIWFKKKSSS